MNRLFTTALLEIESSGAASAISDAKFVTGTAALLKDASTAIMIIAPILALVAISIMAVIKMLADENDAIRWKKRMVGVGIALVIVFSASAIISVVAHYYK